MYLEAGGFDNPITTVQQELERDSSQRLDLQFEVLQVADSFIKNSRGIFGDATRDNLPERSNSLLDPLSSSLLVVGIVTFYSFTFPQSKLVVALNFTNATGLCITVVDKKLLFDGMIEPC